MKKQSVNRLAYPFSFFRTLLPAPKCCMLLVCAASFAINLGCAANNSAGKGGGVKVSISPKGTTTVGVTLTQQFTATVTGTSNQAVTWTLSDTTCTGTPNPCGAISSAGLYTAPAASPNPPAVTITATSQADTMQSNSATAKVVQITTQVTPSPATLGIGLQQQFTAKAIPDNAPQTFAWAITGCTSGGMTCGTINTSTGLYKAPATVPTPATFSVQATSTVDPTGISKANATLVQSRLSGQYAFSFSGYDAAGSPVAASGNFVADPVLQTLQGTLDEITVNSHSQLSLDNMSNFQINSNNHGMLTLHTSADSHTYKLVFAAGEIPMIEFDAAGWGSGVIKPANSASFKTSALAGSFVFGFNGVELSGKPLAFAGVFQADGAGHIGSTTSPTGLFDVNDNGAPGTSASVSGSYSIGASGTGTMTLTATDLARSFIFDIHVAGGQTTKGTTTPLTVFAVSHAPLSNNYAAGTIVFQDPGPTYNDGDVSGNLVAHLTGVDDTGTHTQVSLTSAKSDGQGHITGSYDANNAGVVPTTVTFSTGYGYAATSGGRYTITLLGDPNATPAVPPVPFILYCSASNRGFLLDQSSASVLTGSLYPQKSGPFAASDLAGSFAAATLTSRVSGSSQVAQNLLFTPTNTAVSGVQDETDGGKNAGQPVVGAYTLTTTGTGTVNLTAPTTTNSIIYLIDTSHFLSLSTDSTNKDSTVVFSER